MQSFLRQDKKRRPFNTNDCLIEVTAWGGSTADIYIQYIQQ
jgi:hypothetical protein